VKKFIKEGREKKNNLGGMVNTVPDPRGEKKKMESKQKKKKKTSGGL